MSPLTALLIGVLQGVLEWLPISSKGSLTMLMISVLGLEPAQALSLSIYLHAGTGLAALVYFRQGVLEMIRHRTEADLRLLRFLILSTLTTGFVGLPIFMLSWGASAYGEALLALTGAALIVTGLVQRGARQVGERTAGSLGDKEGLLAGVAQGLSAIPGLSRSGVTSSVLLIRGLSGDEALRASFLMAIPASFAAALGLAYVEGVPMLEPSFIFSLASSFFSGILSIGALLRLARRVRFWGLCVLLGALALFSPLLSLF